MTEVVVHEPVNIVGLKGENKNKGVGTDGLLGELNALVCIFTGGFTIIMIVSRHLES